MVDNPVDDSLPVPETYFRENGPSGTINRFDEHVADPLNEQYNGLPSDEFLGPKGVGSLFSPENSSQTYRK